MEKLLELFRTFLDSGMKGVKIEGIAEYLQEIADEGNMPIVVLERRNVIYLTRRED